MSVYVGKNVTITVQNPVEEDVLDKVADLYNFVAIVAAGTGSHEAYQHSATSEPTPPFGTELLDANYLNIAVSENARFSKSTTVNNEYAMMLFRFKSAIAEADAKKIKFKFEGYGTAPAGNGVTMKLWNHTTSAWEQVQTGSGGADEEITISVTASLTDYIDADGYIWGIVRTTNPSDGATAAVLYCDYAHCFVTKLYFTVDNTPVSDRDQDGVANEVSHVTVKKNDVEVTVSAVVDSSGLVTLASGDFDETDIVLCNYRYDGSPYVAQELSIEPKQTVEGIDGLGSDTIQIWAATLKEIGGTIKEVLKPGAANQLPRVKPMAPSLYDPFDVYDTVGRWTTVAGAPDIYVYSGQNCLRLREYPSGQHGQTKTKAKYKNLELETRLYPASDGGSGARTIIYFRGYFVICRHDVGWLQLVRPDAATILAQSADAVISYNSWHTLRVRIQGSHIRVWVDGALILNVLDSSGTTEQEVKLRIVIRDTYFNWIQVAELQPNDDYGMIVSWTQGGSVVKVGLDKVVFPKASIPSPKNAPVYITTPFRAQSIKTIS